MAMWIGKVHSFEEYKTVCLRKCQSTFRGDSQFWTSSTHLCRVIDFWLWPSLAQLSTYMYGKSEIRELSTKSSDIPSPEEVKNILNEWHNLNTHVSSKTTSIYPFFVNTSFQWGHQDLVSRKWASTPGVTSTAATISCKWALYISIIACQDRWYHCKASVDLYNINAWRL